MHKRGRAAHAAAGDIAEENGVDALLDLKSLAFEDIVDAVGESAPGVGDDLRLGGRDAADGVFDDAVIGEVAAEEPDLLGAVGLVGHPDEPVGPDAEELGAVVVPVLDPEAESRRGPPHLAAGNVDLVVLRQLLELLYRCPVFPCQLHPDLCTKGLSVACIVTTRLTIVQSGRAIKTQIEVHGRSCGSLGAGMFRRIRGGRLSLWGYQRRGGTKASSHGCSQEARHLGGLPRGAQRVVGAPASPSAGGASRHRRTVHALGRPSPLSPLVSATHAKRTPRTVRPAPEAPCNHGHAPAREIPRRSY